MDENSVSSDETKHKAVSVPWIREQDAIYQKGRIVGRVLEPQVDLSTKEIRFGEIRDSDHLLIPDECEFQKYRILIQKVAFATKVDRRPGQTGRTLGGCVADILGYIE